MNFPNPANKLPNEQNLHPSNTFIDSHLPISVSKPPPPDRQSNLNYFFGNNYFNLLESSLVVL